MYQVQRGTVSLWKLIGIKKSHTTPHHETFNNFHDNYVSFVLIEARIKFYCSDIQLLIEMFRRGSVDINFKYFYCYEVLILVRRLNP